MNKILHGHVRSGDAWFWTVTHIDAGRIMAAVEDMTTTEAAAIAQSQQTVAILAQGTTAIVVCDPRVAAARLREIEQAEGYHGRR
jgi:hypothetical protein